MSKWNKYLKYALVCLLSILPVWAMTAIILQNRELFDAEGPAMQKALVNVALYFFPCLMILFSISLWNRVNRNAAFILFFHLYPWLLHTSKVSFNSGAALFVVGCIATLIPYAIAAKLAPAIKSTLHNCRACGYYSEELPWGADNKTPSHKQCQCCGAEFGYDDANLEALIKFRQRWIKNGYPWYNPRLKPDDWDEKLQFKHRAAIPR